MLRHLKVYYPKKYEEFYVNVLSIGGATKDMFLRYIGTDVMTITKGHRQLNYMFFESGEKIEIDDLVIKTGGGATNSATSFKRLGIDTACFCKVGNDQAGQYIVNTLEECGIDAAFVKLSSSHQTGTSFIINSPQGDYTIFAYRGANGHIEKTEFPFDHIKKVSQLYITSLSHNSAKLLPEIAEFAKKNGVRVAINPGVSQLAQGTQKLKESLAFIDTFILNSSEAKTFMIALTQTDSAYKKAFECAQNTNLCNQTIEPQAPYLLTAPIQCENSNFGLDNFFKEVMKMGPKIVIVTNGKNGVYLATHNEILFHPSLPTKVINTVGAGDAFGSCFVASQMLGYDIKTSLKHGIINSSSVLEHIGAKDGLLTHSQLKDRAAKVSDQIQTFKFQ